jgi:uncharacterized protein YegL
MKFIHFFLIGAIGCSQVNFTGTNGSGKSKKPVKDQNSGTNQDDKQGSDAVKGSNNTNSETNIENIFASEGKSLDAYFIIDVSGSLEKNDPDCQRYRAFLEFRNSLESFLGASGDVRASLILFSERPRFHSTNDQFIQMSDSDFESAYRRSICFAQGETNPGDAFSLAKAKAEEIMAASKKDLKSVLFVTDGMPTIGTSDQILARADLLKELFESRVFSVLLDPGQILQQRPPGILGFQAFPLSPSEFLEYVSGSKDRVRSVSNSSDLSAAYKSFLGK